MNARLILSNMRKKMVLDKSQHSAALLLTVCRNSRKKRSLSTLTFLVRVWKMTCGSVVLVAPMVD